MVVKIGDTSVSIPTAIDKWAHESEDNMTEFNGMIDSLMYAVNKVMKSKYSIGPYQKIYTRQLKELMANGLTEEEANKTIERVIEASDKDYNVLEKTMKENPELAVAVLKNLL